MKYVGKYRVLPHLDEHTNDVPRDHNMHIDQSYDDIYIACQNKIEIYNYGKGVLAAYIPSLGRGHNIIKSIYEDRIGNVKSIKLNYELMYENLIEDGMLLYIEETDTEVIFRFHNKDLESLIGYLKPRTSGAKISPFSTRNLPINRDYKLSDIELKEYQDITGDVPRDKLLLIHRANTEFVNSVIGKKGKLNTTADMRKNCLKGREYIHFKGYWDEYLKFLKRELEDI